MNCEQARQSWHDEHDGVVTPDEEAALAEHLRTCEACRAYHSRMDQVSLTLSALRASSECIGQPPRPTLSPRWMQAWRVGRVAAVLGFVVLAGLFYSHWGRIGIDGANIVIDNTANGPQDDAINATEMARIALTGESAERFIPLERETSQPHVHLFWLYPTYEPTRQDVNDQPRP